MDNNQLKRLVMHKWNWQKIKLNGQWVYKNKTSRIINKIQHKITRYHLHISA